MARKLSPWCKHVKIALIKRDMKVSDLAEELSMERTYVSAIVNGRTYSEPAIKKISDFLNIADDYVTL